MGAEPLDMDSRASRAWGDARKRKGAAMIDAFPLTERQQDLIFKSLDHCRRVLDSEPGDDGLKQELTDTMRVFAERE